MVKSGLEKTLMALTVPSACLKGRKMQTCSWTALCLALGCGPASRGSCGLFPLISLSHPAESSVVWLLCPHRLEASGIFHEGV